jgi:hypothetical protein
MTKPTQFQGWPENLDVPYGPYRAVIERVVDGDTVHAISGVRLRSVSFCRHEYLAVAR